MTLAQQIEACIEATRKIKEENPSVKSVWHDIENASYDEMKEWAEKHFDSLDQAGNKARLHHSDHNGSVIFAFSKPLKIKTTIEVEELEQTTI